MKLNKILFAGALMMLAACSNGIDVADDANGYADAEISVGGFPSYNTDLTRATSVPGANDKTAWAAGDVIYVQLNGAGKWYTLTYADGKWGAPEGFSMAKTDTYKAVYAPNYEPNSESNELVLKEGATASTAEYLTCEGKRPIDIYFKRDYSRLRVYVGESASKVVVELGEGFTGNDGGKAGSFTFTANESGNVYVYGSWTEGTSVKVKNVADKETGLYCFVGRYERRNIKDASVAGRSYAMDVKVDEDDKWIVYDLDYVGDDKTDNTSVFTAKGVTKAKLVGAAESTDQKFCNASNITLLDMTGATGLKSVAEEFAYCNWNLTEVRFPKQLESIGRKAFFNDCGSLSNITWPEQLKTIGEGAFGNLQMSSLVLPEGLEEIEDHAFTDAGLSTIVLPASLKTIGGEAFENCGQVTSVTCKAVEPPITLGKLFMIKLYTRTLYVPSGSVEKYKDSSSWNSGEFDAIVAIEE